MKQLALDFVLFAGASLGFGLALSLGFGATDLGWAVLAAAPGAVIAAFLFSRKEG